MITHHCYVFLGNHSKVFLVKNRRMDLKGYVKQYWCCRGFGLQRHCSFEFTSCNEISFELLVFEYVKIRKWLTSCIDVKQHAQPFHSFKMMKCIDFEPIQVRTKYPSILPNLCAILILIPNLIWLPMILCVTFFKKVYVKNLHICWA
jgi:hypothetical protein